jgi:hypothetical protein
LFREDTLRITGAALTTIGAGAFAAAPFAPFEDIPFATAPTTIGAGAFAAATLADNFSTNAFTSLKFDLAANASLFFSAADGKSFVLADLAANASLTAIAFLTANICVASSNAFLNAGSDVAASEDGTIVIGADAPFAAAFGDGDGDADAAFGDATTTIGAAAAAATAPSPTDAPFADAFGESKLIIGDDCTGATTATGAAAAPLDLNPGGPGKNTGNATEPGPPFAPVDLILTIILGFGLLLPLEDDHELFGGGATAAADTAFADAFGDATTTTGAAGAGAADAAATAPSPTDATFADAFGESKLIIGDDCTGATTATGAAAATAPLNLNPGGPGKNIGSAAGPPFAPRELILTIILGFGFGFLLLLLDDHELFDDFRDAPFTDAAFAFGDAPFEDAIFAAADFGNVTFGDADAAESAEPTDDQCTTHDFGDVTFGAPFEDADDVTESSEPTDGQWSTHDFGNAAAAAFGDAPFADAFGESKFIIGDDCAGATTATGAAVATAPLDLNPGGPGKNTGSGTGPPFASVDLILTIILGFGLLLLLLLDDHELFNDFGDVLFDDDDDDDDDDDVPLLEDFFEPDAVAAVDVFDTVDAVPDDKLLSEDFLELDDAYDPFTIKPRFTPL